MCSGVFSHCHPQFSSDSRGFSSRGAAVGSPGLLPFHLVFRVVQNNINGVALPEIPRKVDLPDFYYNTEELRR